MNILKKMLFLTAFTIIYGNVECMNMPVSAHQAQSNNEQDQPIINRSKIFEVVDTLVQAASIYSVDSTNSQVAQGLAGARVGVNCINVLGKVLNFLDSFPYANVFHTASCYFRGKNVLEDVNNYKNANVIASQNSSRKNDEKLKNKQYCQYAWLAVNKILPLIRLNLKLKDEYVLSILSEFSELYRQKMMYAMISKQKAS